MIVLQSEASGFGDLQWYLISPRNSIYKAKNLLIQLMTWISILCTPLLFVFDVLDSQLKPELRANLSHSIIPIIWLVDISWCVEIILSFLQASETNRTFKTIAMAYVKSYFFFDVMATVPAMLTMQNDE